MGWAVEEHRLPYLKCWYEEPEACRKLVLESDVVVFGGVEEERYIEERLQSDPVQRTSVPGRAVESRIPQRASEKIQRPYKIPETGCIPALFRGLCGIGLPYCLFLPAENV